MNLSIRPDRVAPPAAAYELAMLSESPARLLHTSGIIGSRPDGTIAGDVGEQAAEVWRTLGALLDDAGMTVSDIVSMTTYVVVGQELGPVMAARDAALAGHRCASTLITVPQLVQPDWLVEVSIIASR